MSAPRVVVLTGAGISADSGLATFRGAGGMWEGHRAEDVATPEAWRRDPELVWRFYQHRRAQLEWLSSPPHVVNLCRSRRHRLARRLQLDLKPGERRLSLLQRICLPADAGEEDPASRQVCPVTLGSAGKSR